MPKKTNHKRGFVWTFLSVLTPLMLIAFCACGRETKVYPGSPAITAQAAPPADPIITITDGRNDLPIGFYDQSINQAKVDLALDGTTSTSVAARLTTYPTTNSQGSFNGTGTGNRAFIGNANYSQKKLSSFSTLTFDAKIAAGTETVSVLLLVDLDCSGSSVRLFVADAASLAPGNSQSSGYTRFNASFSENRWHVSGVAIEDTSTAPATTLVPALGSGAPASLTSFIAKYPNSCIRNAVSTDDALPKNIPLGGIIFTLGQDITSDANTAFINRIEIGTDIVEASDWGKK